MTTFEYRFCTQFQQDYMIQWFSPSIPLWFTISGFIGSMLKVVIIFLLRVSLQVVREQESMTSWNSSITRILRWLSNSMLKWGQCLEDALDDRAYIILDVFEGSDFLIMNSVLHQVIWWRTQQGSLAIVTEKVRFTFCHPMHFSNIILLSKRCGIELCNQVNDIL